MKTLLLFIIFNLILVNEAKANSCEKAFDKAIADLDSARINFENASYDYHKAIADVDKAIKKHDGLSLIQQFKAILLILIMRKFPADFDKAIADVDKARDNFDKAIADLKKASDNVKKNEEYFF